MREIKFRGLDYNNKFAFGYLVYSAFDTAFNIVSVGEIPPTYQDPCGDIYSESVNVRPETIGQYTGLKDKNSKEIFDGDLLNIFFTSSDKEHIHDCIFRAETGVFGDLQFKFIKLLWESFGHNQYPISQTLSIRYRTLDVFFIDNVETIIVPDTYNKNHLSGQKWKSLDKSAYFKIIGNIHENPELLEAKP